MVFRMQSLFLSYPILSDLIQRLRLLGHTTTDPILSDLHSQLEAVLPTGVIKIEISLIPV